MNVHSLGLIHSISEKRQRKKERDVSHPQSNRILLAHASLLYRSQVSQTIKASCLPIGRTMLPTSNTGITQGFVMVWELPVVLAMLESRGDSRCHDRNQQYDLPRYHFRHPIAPFATGTVCQPKLEPARRTWHWPGRSGARVIGNHVVTSLR